jgi:hypothetical protein
MPAAGSQIAGEAGTTLQRCLKQQRHAMALLQAQTTATPYKGVTTGKRQEMSSVLAHGLLYSLLKDAAAARGTPCRGYRQGRLGVFTLQLSRLHAARRAAATRSPHLLGAFAGVC